MVALLKMPSRRQRWEAAPVADDHPALKFTGAPLNRERRNFVRKECNYRVEARRHDHTISAHRNPHLSLALRDLSYGGLCASSDIPLDAGERISIFFPPNGPNRGWDAYGRVIRCQPSTFGYRIAVQFDSLPAA